MTRRTQAATALRTARQRLPRPDSRRVGRPHGAAIHHLGFACFRLVPIDDADQPFAFCRLLEPRSTMRALVGL